jgi:subtilisin-like proprotein convertase family protein
MFVAAIIAAAAVPGAVLAQVNTYTTTDAPIAIPDNSAGTFTACQTIVIPPGAGTIGDLDIRTAITHTWVGDLTIRLESPGGASTLMLMNRPGRPPAAFGRSADFASATPITFDDAAPSGRSAETIGEEPPGTACGGTTVVGQTCGPDNYIPAPDPTDTPIAGLGTNLAQFNGTAASGTWTLCVADSAGGDTGTLTSWSMLVTPAAPPPPPTTPAQFGYAPPPGSTVSGTGGGLIGSTSNFTITPSIATPGTGTGAAATTTLTCTAPTAPFAGFTQTVTAIGDGAISGGPLTGTCTRGSTAVTQTLTCSENQGGMAVSRTWTLNCPAGQIPAVPVNATSAWSLIALMLALFGFAAVAVRRQG